MQCCRQHVHFIVCTIANSFSLCWVVVYMQAATYLMLENLKANLLATFLTISHDHAEVKQKIGSTEEVVRKVESRPEDSSFALSLGRVLLQHSTSFMVQHNAGDV